MPDGPRATGSARLRLQHPRRLPRVHIGALPVTWRAFLRFTSGRSEAGLFMRLPDLVPVTPHPIAAADPYVYGGAHLFKEHGGGLGSRRWGAGEYSPDPAALAPRSPGTRDAARVHAAGRTLRREPVETSAGFRGLRNRPDAEGRALQSAAVEVAAAHNNGSLPQFIASLQESRERLREGRCGRLTCSSSAAEGKARALPLTSSLRCRHHARSR